MTNSDKYDELIAEAQTQEDKDRLIRTKSFMSPIVANMEFVTKEQKELSIK
jgi:hypothetical protein